MRIVLAAFLCLSFSACSFKHQNKIKKNKPISGVKKMPGHWKNFVKPDDKTLKERLTKEQFDVARRDKTEKPFKNEFWDNKEEGIYVDIISGEPLFSSQHKYKSGTGWPSFYQPIEGVELVEKKDKSFFRIRTEIRSKIADSHLGHVFDDGPGPNGKRYCMNSAAMKFIPKNELEAQGYAEFLKLFK